MIQYTHCHPSFLLDEKELNTYHIYEEGYYLIKIKQKLLSIYEYIFGKETFIAYYKPDKYSFHTYSNKDITISPNYVEVIKMLESKNNRIEIDSSWNSTLDFGGKEGVIIKDSGIKLYKNSTE
jgi:hypothetical protein